MAIHIDGSGNVQKNTNITKQEEVQEEQKAFSIFDVNQDGKISTSEQMYQVRGKASTFGNYVDVWSSKIARFFQNVITYVTNSTAAEKATEIVQQCIDNAMKYLQHSVDKGDESPFIKKSAQLVENDDGINSKDPQSYTSTRNENGEKVRVWNNGYKDTYSRENDFLLIKESKDGKTYTYSYNDDGSYTVKGSDGTKYKYNANNEMISKTNPNGKTYTYSYNDDGSYTMRGPDGKTYNYKYNEDNSCSAYDVNNTWIANFSKDATLAGELTQKGNYKFYPSKSISISNVANMLGVSESELRKANPKAAKAGEFVPPNDIYVPKSILPKDFDPSKVIV